MEKVTLYIPCFNASKYLRQCLESVLNQSYPIDEILIIDDGSTDDTIEIARQFPVKVISHGQNKGLASSRNTAFREARNEFIAALDSDCAARQNWLEELMKNFKDMQVAGAGGRLVEKYTHTPADEWRSRRMAQHWGDIEIKNPYFLFGSNTVLKKSVVSISGFYNEKFRTNYEDVYLSKEIFKKGFQLIYCPTAIAEHLKKDTIRGVLKSFWRWYYYDSVSWAKLVPYFLCSDFKNRRGRMLILDILMIFYLIWLDFRNHFFYASDKKNISK